MQMPSKRPKGKKPQRQKASQPVAEIEVLAARDIYEEGIPVSDQDAAELRSITTRAQLEQHLEGFIRHETESVPNRIVEFRDLKTGRLHRAMAYDLTFVRFEDMEDEVISSFRLSE
jgi:hypothetical protein